MRPRRRLALAFSTLAAAAAREELLVSTQIVHRHGDRTPITPLADRSYWATIVPSAAELAALADGTAVVPADAVATRVHGHASLEKGSATKCHSQKKFTCIHFTIWRLFGPWVGLT